MSTFTNRDQDVTIANVSARIAALGALGDDAIGQIIVWDDERAALGDAAITALRAEAKAAGFATAEGQDGDIEVI